MAGGQVERGTLIRNAPNFFLQQILINRAISRFKAVMKRKVSG